MENSKQIHEISKTVKHTFQHWDLSDELLSEEVVHLYHVILILDVNVDGEMSVHRLHLVLESLWMRRLVPEEIKRLK